jgi:hypothetical protein
LNFECRFGHGAKLNEEEKTDESHNSKQILFESEVKGWTEEECQTN